MRWTVLLPVPTKPKSHIRPHFIPSGIFGLSSAVLPQSKVTEILLLAQKLPGYLFKVLDLIGKAGSFDALDFEQDDEIFGYPAVSFLNLFDQLGPPVEIADHFRPLHSPAVAEPGDKHENFVGKAGNFHEQGIIDIVLVGLAVRGLDAQVGIQGIAVFVYDKQPFVRMILKTNWQPGDDFVEHPEIFQLADINDVMVANFF